MFGAASKLKEDNFAAVPIRDLVSWRTQGSPGALHLPPIQRSLVWRNTQIINYWDSLLRGYPAGLFLVHQVGDAIAKGKKEDGTTGHSAGSRGSDAAGELLTVDADDWQLFDGQQRMSTLLLGLDEGQLAGDLRLWIDFGSAAPKDLKYALRISSRGQPFGYPLGDPGSKHPLGKRRKWWSTFGEDKERSTAFEVAQDLIDAEAIVPFSDVWRAVVEEVPWEEFRRDRCLSVENKHGEESCGGVLNETSMDEKGRSLFEDLGNALNGEAIVRRLDKSIVQDPQEYVRFFARVGQGGTALTDNELTYSIIKQAHPHVRHRMHEIEESDLRFASEVDLVIAALRLARLQNERMNFENRSIPRPSPSYASAIQRDEEAEVRARFMALLPETGEGSPLKDLLERLRDMLTGKTDGESGLPEMLMARLPREAVDMLLLLADIERNDAKLAPVLRSFALYVLLVVEKVDKAADRMFEAASAGDWSPSEDGLAQWRIALEEGGYACQLPTQDEIKKLRAAVNDHALGDRRAELLGWAERFTECDHGERKPGEWLRRFLWMGHLNKRALMWLQRKYIKKAAPNFVPLSTRDDDLPLDFDHVIPRNRFNFHWGSEKTRLSGDLSTIERDSFARSRDVIGNALGNFRWLDASDNRARGDGPLEDRVEMAEDHLIENRECWNELIPDGREWTWSREEIAQFQALIELRTVDLCAKLLDDLPAR